MARNGDDASVQVLGQDGTVATADATLLYRVQRSKVTDVYENIGTGYTTTVVKPTARTCVRAGFTKLPMITAATQSFQQVEADIDACIKEKLQPNGINVVDFQLRELRLSAQLQNAIDGQIAAKMLGVDSPLDDKYLQLYYLQVLQQFAKNGNSIVVTGGNTPGFTLPLPTPSTTSTTTGK
jgi:regulator of protease activity HflC (stomatin/prohibitin superfamily)